MEIKVSNLTSGKIKVKVTIESEIVWSFKYAAMAGVTHKGNVLEGKKSYTFDLGEFENLIDFKNYWDVIFTNPKDERPYKILIEWFNGQTKLGEWTREASIKAGVSNIIIQDEVKFT